MRTNTNNISLEEEPKNWDDENEQDEDCSITPEITSLRAGHDAEIEKDPMSIEIADGRWISFIPGLTLTTATILFAFIGMGIGLAIALTVNSETALINTTYSKTIELNITLESAQENNQTITDIESIKLIDGEQVVIYTETFNVTNMTEVAVNKLSDDWYAIIEFPGKLWINALKLLVLPLIILMMIILPSRVDEIGYVGKKAVPLYLFTSLCAAIQGTILGWTIQPGFIGNNQEEANSSGSDIEAPEDKLSITEVVLNVFYNAVPENIINAMSDFGIFGIILFFLFIGILLSNKNIVPLNEREIVLKFNKAMLRCIMKALVYVIWFSPFGMCSLICLKIASTENLLTLLVALGFYLLCVVIGLFTHLFIFYPSLLWLTTRGNGYSFFCQIYEAPLLAFATSSSAATLPRSLQMAEKVGIRTKIYQFILPLGSAINMDGSAVTFPIQIALIAQLNGIVLDVGTIFIVMILSVIVSIGAAPIPNAGMVYVVMLLEAAGLSQYVEGAIGTLFVLDWLVDRMGTAVNVTSDQFVAKMIDDVDKIEKQNVDCNKVKVLCGCCVCGKIDKDALRNYDKVTNQSNAEMISKVSKLEIETI